MPLVAGRKIKGYQHEAHWESTCFFNLFPCGLLLFPYSFGRNFPFGFKGNLKFKKTRREVTRLPACLSRFHRLRALPKQKPNHKLCSCLSAAVFWNFLAGSRNPCYSCPEPLLSQHTYCINMRHFCWSNGEPSQIWIEVWELSENGLEQYIILFPWAVVSFKRVSQVHFQYAVVMFSHTNSTDKRNCMTKSPCTGQILCWPCLQHRLSNDFFRIFLIRGILWFRGRIEMFLEVTALH